MAFRERKPARPNTDGELNRRLRHVDAVLDGLVGLGPKLGIPSEFQTTPIRARTRQGVVTIGHDRKKTSYSPWIVLGEEDGESRIGCVQKEIRSFAIGNSGPIQKRKVLTIKTTPETVDGIVTLPDFVTTSRLLEGSVALEVPSSNKDWTTDIAMGPWPNLRFIMRACTIADAERLTGACEEVAFALDSAARNPELNPVLAATLQPEEYSLGS